MHTPGAGALGDSQLSQREGPDLPTQSPGGGTRGRGAGSPPTSPPAVGRGRMRPPAEPGGARSCALSHPLRSAGPTACDPPGPPLGPYSSSGPVRTRQRLQMPGQAREEDSPGRSGASGMGTPSGLVGGQGKPAGRRQGSQTRAGVSLPPAPTPPHPPLAGQPGPGSRAAQRV